MGEKDDYDSENSWISDGLPSSSRRRRRGGGRWEVVKTTTNGGKMIMIKGEIEKFIIRQPPMGEKDDYDSENSWISDVLPSHSKKKERRQRHHKEQIPGGGNFPVAISAPTRDTTQRPA